MKAAIVLNGVSLNRRIEEEYIICADGGARLVDKDKINLIVGDMDSISDDYFDVEKVQVPIEKDFSDGELAIKQAKHRGFSEVVIYAADGGRTDHMFVNYMLLAFANSLALKACLKGENSDVYYLDKDAAFEVDKYKTISFLPFLSKEAVLTVANVKYPLEHLRLSVDNCSRGLSNVVLTNRLDIKVEEGSVLFFYNFV